MPAFGDYVLPVPGEDAIVLRPRDPYRLIREVFQVLLRYGGLSREARRHLVHAFNAAIDPALERRIIAALSERWEGEDARGLADTIADLAWEACPEFEPAADDTGELAVLP